MAVTITKSLYTQARAGCNAAAIVVGRLTIRARGKLTNRIKLWKSGGPKVRID